MPLDVCAFCVQFLPSSYNINGDAEEDARAVHTAGYAGPVRPPSSSISHLATRCRSGGQMRSSLVIQHQLLTKVTTSSALGKSPRTAARLHRPRSGVPAANISTSPRPAPTYRLLSNDATRVLRIESPAAVLHSMAVGQDSNPLTATDVMGSLQAQEQQQNSAILRAESSKREASYQQRALATKNAQKVARERAERMTGTANPDSPQHRNIIDALIKGAGTLYTGVAVAQPGNNPLAATSKARLVADNSKIVTKKHGRHFKTELFFPAIPVHTRPTKKH